VKDKAFEGTRADFALRAATRSQLVAPVAGVHCTILWSMRREFEGKRACSIFRTITRHYYISYRKYCVQLCGHTSSDPVAFLNSTIADDTLCAKLDMLVKKNRFHCVGLNGCCLAGFG
jgi:hypothetical protein